MAFIILLFDASCVYSILRVWPPSIDASPFGAVLRRFYIYAAWFTVHTAWRFLRSLQAKQAGGDYYRPGGANSSVFVPVCAGVFEKTFLRNDALYGMIWPVAKPR